MDEPSPLRGAAIALGALGLVAAVSGMVMALSAGMVSPTAGVLIRVGAILLALSLVLPVVRRPSPVTAIVVGGFLALVLLRPGLIWAALIAWVALLIFGRQRNTADSDS